MNEQSGKKRDIDRQTVRNRQTNSEKQTQTDKEM